MQIHLIPVLLSVGRRLFDHRGTADYIELELISAIEGPGVTHLRYRIRALPLGEVFNVRRGSGELPSPG